MFTSIIAALLGILTGTFTGITPGVHINLVASIIAGSITALQARVAPFDIGVFLLTMSITHTFLDAIPSVFLGVAEGSELLSLLPSQRLVLQGRGRVAVLLLTIGALGCLMLGIALVPVFVHVFPPIYTVLKPHTWLLLSIVLAWMVLRERNANTRFWSLITIASSGVLGLIVLRTLHLDDPLLPMLSGLFGTSALAHTIVSATQLPPQEDAVLPPTKRSQTGLALLSGTLAGSVIALLPGVGPAQAAVAARTVLPSIADDAFLILVGGINTVNMALSLVTMSTLGFARNGSLAVMLSIVHRPTDLELLQYCALALIAGGAATVLTLWSARAMGALLPRINYRMVSACVLLFVTALVVWRSGPLGLLVLLVATATGLVAVLTKAPRHHLMACILIPVIWATI